MICSKSPQSPLRPPGSSRRPAIEISSAAGAGRRTGAFGVVLVCALLAGCASAKSKAAAEAAEARRAPAVSQIAAKTAALDQRPGLLDLFVGADLGKVMVRLPPARGARRMSWG